MLLDGYQSYLAFVGVFIFVLSGRDSRNGAQVPKTAPPNPWLKSRVMVIMTGMIEIGTPKIPKKEKSFVISCICFLDHQLLYYYWLVPCHVTLLFRSAGMLEGIVWGLVTEAGYPPKEWSRVHNKQATPQRWCFFKGGKKRETEHRATTPACAAMDSATPYLDLHHTDRRFLQHFSCGIVA